MCVCVCVCVCVCRHDLLVVATNAECFPPIVLHYVPSPASRCAPAGRPTGPKPLATPAPGILARSSQCCSDARCSRAPRTQIHRYRYRYGGGGKGSLDPAGCNRRAAGAPRELCSLLELSSLDPGLGARAQGERRAASIARGSRRTRSKKRSVWDYASTGHLVCLVVSSRTVCEGTLSVSVSVSAQPSRRRVL